MPRGTFDIKYNNKQRWRRLAEKNKPIKAPPVTVNKDLLLADICRHSYFDFLKTFWHVIIADEPEWNWHVPYLCKRVQKVMERVFRKEPSPYDLIVNVSPGTTKSTIFSVALTPWAWTRMPECKIINSSFGYSLALDLSRKSRDIIESDLYKRLFPEIVLRDDQNTKSHFMNTKGGMRFATSTGGTVLGMHGHVIVSDDPIDPNDADSLSEIGIKNANRFQRETLPTRKVNKVVTPMILVMQRLHQDDPTGDRLSRAKKSPVRHICLPAECTRGFPVKPLRLRKKYKDDLMDPVRLPRDILRKAEAELGQYGYAGQYGQQPTSRKGGMFHTHKLVVMDYPPPMRRIIRYWDKAGSQDLKGPYTAGVKIGDAGEKSVPRFIVLDVQRFRKNSAAREAHIREIAEQDGIGVEIYMEQEPGSGGKESAENSIRNLAGFRVRAEKPTGDKITRADPFSVQVNRGNVAIIHGEWNKEYVDEMRMYGPTGKYKDQIDASAGAFNELARPKLVIGAI